MILRDALVLVNGTDLSDQVTSVSYATSYEEIDVTPVGDTVRVWTKGLSETVIDVGFLPDMGNANQTLLQSLLDSPMSVRIEVRPTSSAVSSTNPAQVLSGVMTDYRVLDGGVGEAASSTIRFVGYTTPGIEVPEVPGLVFWSDAMVMSDSMFIDDGV